METNAPPFRLSEPAKQALLARLVDVGLDPVVSRTTAVRALRALTVIEKANLEQRAANENHDRPDS